MHQVPADPAEPLLNLVKCHFYADAEDLPLNFLIYHFVMWCCQTSQVRLSDRTRWGIFWVRGRSMGWEMPFSPCKSRWWSEEKRSLRLSSSQHPFPCYSLACIKLIASHKTVTERGNCSFQTVIPFSPKSESSRACRRASLSYWCGGRNKVVQGHTTAVFISESRSFKWPAGLLHQRYLDGAELWGLQTPKEVKASESIPTSPWHWAVGNSTPT